MTCSLLFVCLGNICRSPMAEGALRSVGEKREKMLTVDSAGTGSWHVGDPPDHRAQEIALVNGTDISGQRARQINQADFSRFDHIIAMDRSVLADIGVMRPGAASAGVSLFLDHVSDREGQDVADPYYGGEEGFALAWRDIMTGAEALVAMLERDIQAM